ncbi:MAG: endonuclease/exonuclease/phosphatase family protein [Mycobacteriales bacterium]
MVALPSLTVACYNVRGLRDDPRAVADVIRAMAPDLLVLAEAPRTWLRRRRCAALAAEVGMRIVAGLRERGEGNLILAGPEISVLASTTLRLPRRPFQRPRTAVLARCVAFGSAPYGSVPSGSAQFNAAPITVVGTHLSTVAAERGDQIERVAAAAQAFSEVDDALIVAGDFNEAPGGVVWQRLSTLGLVDVGAADPAPTFSTRRPRRRIDAVFCSDSLAPRNYRVWRAGEVVSASDHFPIIVELEPVAMR